MIYDNNKIYNLFAKILKIYHETVFGYYLNFAFVIVPRSGKSSDNRVPYACVQFYPYLSLLMIVIYSIFQILSIWDKIVRIWYTVTTTLTPSGAQLQKHRAYLGPETGN